MYLAQRQSLDSPNWKRLGAVAGIAFCVLAAIVDMALSPNTPAFTASAGQISDYIRTHQDALGAANYVGAVAFGLFLWFAATLRNLLAGAEETGSTFAALSFGGAVTLVALYFAGSAAEVALTLRAPIHADASLQTLYLLSQAGFLLFPFPIAILIGGAAVVILRTGVLPRWLGWLGCLVVVVELVDGLAAGVRSGPLALDGGVSQAALPAFLLWVLVASITIVVRVPAVAAASRSTAGSTLMPVTSR